MTKQKIVTTNKKVKDTAKEPTQTNKGTAKITQEEIDTALNKIFDSASQAINAVKQKETKISLDQVDATLKAIFDSINRANIDGDKIKIPDFNKVLQS